jgi:hypothetical protein
MSKVKVLNEPAVRNDPRRLLSALDELGALQKAKLGRFMTYWAASVAVCIVGALGAVAILSYAFVAGLAK